MHKNYYESTGSKYLDSNECNLLKGVDIVRSYGTIYNSTGGGDKTDKTYKFVYKFLDNRVLGLYLKYLGITTLTPATLVPIALIYGQSVFKKHFKKMKNKQQTGGKIPVIDNKLLGTYLTIAGLTQLKLSLGTLVPLGLAMAVYRVVKKQNKSGQTGGNMGQLLGNSVPAGYLQLGRNAWQGVRTANNIFRPLTESQQFFRSDDYLNHELQLPPINMGNNSIYQSNTGINDKGLTVPIIQWGEIGKDQSADGVLRPMPHISTGVSSAPGQPVTGNETLTNAWSLLADGLDADSVVFRNAMA